MHDTGELVSAPAAVLMWLMNNLIWMKLTVVKINRMMMLVVMFVVMVMTDF